MRGQRTSIGALLVAVALMLRILVPAGFMPSTEKGFAIVLCTAEGAVSAWIDAGGQVRKGEPSAKDHFEHPCAFSGFAAALDMPFATPLAIPALAISAAILPSTLEAAVGRGLAAPPPPATGPPSVA